MYIRTYILNMSFSFNRLKRMEIESKQKSLKMSLLTNRTKARPESSGKASEFRSSVLTNPKQVLKKMTFHIPGSRKPPSIPKGVGFLGLCMNHLEHHIQNYICTYGYHAYEAKETKTK